MNIRINIQSKKVIVVLLFIVSTLFFSHQLGLHGLEYRDDEIFYVRSTQEMVNAGNYFSPTYFGEDRFQKPILFYWLILIAYGDLGIGWFAARFVSVVFAGLTLCLTWLLGAQLFNRRVAFVSTMVLATVPLFFRHARNAVPDMVLNFFIVFALYCAFEFIRDPHQRWYRYIFFVACALGFMTKGFAALVIPVVVLIVYAVSIRRTEILRGMHFPFGAVIFLVIVAPWFWYMAAVHGQDYINYMIRTETLNRAVMPLGRPGALTILKTFAVNTRFYFITILSYFAPWSFCAFAAVPVASWFSLRRSDKREGLYFVLIWFFAVFIFFSLLHARINHLVLVLSTPFALLVGFFLLESFAGLPRFVRGALLGYRRVCLFLIVLGGLTGILFVRVFLLGSSAGLVFAAVLIAWVMAVIIFIRKNAFMSAVALCIFVVTVYAQAGLLSQARLTPHAFLRVFAQTVHDQDDQTAIIGVGSHDIQEKEWQVYFNRRIQKAATGNEPETRALLKRLFLNVGRVYCLMTEKDYERYAALIPQNKVRVIQEDYMLRRRTALDKDFFTALIRRDRDAINRYLMEKVVLLRKDG